MLISDIKKFYAQVKTPEHIQKHMEQVAKVAVMLAKNIKRNAAPGTKEALLNVDFIKKVALLHDVLKPLSFKEKSYDDPTIWKKLRKKYPSKHDTEVAALMLQKMNEEKLAASVRTQQFDAVISKDHPLATLEEKIVYYADKRVAHTQIVSLEKRLEEGEKRYGEKTPTLIRQKIFELEHALCSLAHTEPENLN